MRMLAWIHASNFPLVVSTLLPVCKFGGVEADSLDLKLPDAHLTSIYNIHEPSAIAAPTIDNAS
jgi:hypothetical protein